MPTEGPARAIRGPIPVNSPFIPPSLIQSKSLRLASYASILEDQNINFNIGIKHVLNGIIIWLKSCINEILDAKVIWNRTVVSDTKDCYIPPNFHQSFPSRHL